MISFFKERIKVRNTSENHGLDIQGELGLECTGLLPVVFIPSFTVDRLAAANLDYKEVFKNLSHNVTDKTSELSKLISIDECLILETLNRVMMSGGKTLNSWNWDYRPIQKYLGFDINDTVLKSVLLEKVIPSMSDDNMYEEEYDIVVTAEYVFIIMNTNSFYHFDTMYDKLSKDLCELLLTLIDDSFVYRSKFFKHLVNNRFSSKNK